MWLLFSPFSFLSNSSRLKFKIKDKDSFGLLKCKAKNEVGLQQKPCLFQVLQAPNPTFKHTCSLLNVSSTSLQVTCQPSEHLKSEEFEFINGNSSSISHNNQISSDQSQEQQRQQQSGMTKWLNLEAMRQQTYTDSSSSSSSLSQPNLRVVFPPNWILGELFRLNGSSNNETGDTNKYSNQNHQLVAYIVVGAAHQLANIKSIVEENKIFSSNPRSVYYVMAKNQAQQQQLIGTNNTHQDMTDSSLFNSNNSSTTIIGQSSQTNRRVSNSGLIIQDSTIQLANSFAFTVPSLEPETKYKLYIYGQNLANKTRDWSLIKGETLQDEGFSSASQTYSSPSEQSASSASYLAHDDLLNGVNLNSSDSSSKLAHNQQQQHQQQNNNSRQQSSSMQKSIVMRSDNDSTLPVDQIEHQTTDKFASNYILDKSFGSGLKENLIERIHFLSQYKDYAISYAKQKPFIAVSLALTILLVVTILIVRTGSMIAHRTRCPRNVCSSKKFNGNGNGNGSLSGTDKKSGVDNANSIKGNFVESEMSSKSENNRQFNSESPNDSYFSNSHQDHSTPTQSSKSNSNSNSNSNQRQQQQRKFILQQQINDVANKQQIYAIETSGSMMDQVEFETAYNRNEGLENNRVYPFKENQQQQQNDQQVLQHRCLLGSLDRRGSLNGGNQEAIYLTETASACPTFFQLHNNYNNSNNISRVSEQQSKTMNFGSIDRRSGATFAVGYSKQQDDCKQQQQEPKQPMLLATDLGQLERGALYLEDASGGAYSAGSFSSTQYSGSEQQGPIALKSRQRVAFDLSNQNQQQQAQPVALKPVPQYLYGSVQLTSSAAGDDCLVISPVLGQQDQAPPSLCSDLNKQQQQHLHLHQQAPNGKLNTNGKGSDSGGSNSGNTADSGHESPPTGDMNSTSFAPTSTKQNQQQLQQHSSINRHINFQQQIWNPLELRHTPQCQIHHHHHHQTVYQLGRNKLNASSPPTGIQNTECCSNASSSVNQNNNEATNNFVMLMELSPGSQESSTLLQSVDSFADLPTGTVCATSDIRNLHNNHQMATSFSTSQLSDNHICNDNHHQQQQSVYLTRQDNLHCTESVGSPEVDNWL